VALVLVLLVASLSFATPPASAQPTRLIVGTTVGIQRSGLLDVLVPVFEQQTGRSVTVVAVSAPQVLSLGARGELEVLLVDAGEDASTYMVAGHGVDRRSVFNADDILVGPRSDPAGVVGSATADVALRRVAAAGADWVSRGDNSALHQLERRLWFTAGVNPVEMPWYSALGQGMVLTLAAATERQAYALADRQSYLEQRDHLDLAVLVQGTLDLLRIYDVFVVNPARGVQIDDAGARAFADFLVGPEAQALIGAHGVDRFGAPLFAPSAGQGVSAGAPAPLTGP